MDYYLDITQKKATSKHLATNRWLNAVYTLLHKKLYDVNNTSVGVSFPNYKLVLGNIIRLHGTKSDLESFSDAKWLAEFFQYCNLSAIKLVPEERQYQVVSRKPILMTEAKLRRLIKRGSLTEAEAKQYRVAMYQKTMLTNPYFELKSASSGQMYRRYLQFTTKNQATAGNFDYFGLSKIATIPVF
jgi:CRISPR-associated endonuclease Csy4